MVFVLHAWFVRAAPRPDACAQVPGKATETVLRRAAGLACCNHGGNARQANLKQGLPVALGRFSGCCSLQLNSAQACLLVSYMPLVNSGGIRSHLLLSVMILTIFTNWISGKRAAPGKLSQQTRRAWHCVCVVSSPRAGFIVLRHARTAKSCIKRQSKNDAHATTRRAQI